MCHRVSGFFLSLIRNIGHLSCVVISTCHSLNDGEVTFNLNFNERERDRHVIGGRCHRKYRNKVTRYHCVETPTRAIGNIKICELITKCSYQFSWYFYLLILSTAKSFWVFVLLFRGVDRPLLLCWCMCGCERIIRALSHHKHFADYATYWYLLLTFRLASSRRFALVVAW